MKKFYDLVLHSSVINKSNTYKVAKKISNFLKIDILHIDDVDFFKYKNIIICCSTFGDEELPFNMEFFLENLKIKSKNYTICELGNYFGVDDKEFGAARIIKHKLKYLNWKLIDECLSLDSVPEIDWQSFSLWIKKINERYRNN